MRRAGRRAGARAAFSSGHAGGFVRSGREGIAGSPVFRTSAWLVIYADVVTLLFTFFVLLISLSVIDARSRSAALGSVSATFGNAGAGADRLSSRPEAVEAHGSDAAPMREGASDAASLYALIAGDRDNDLDFQENSAVQIFSVSADALFLPEDTVQEAGAEAAPAAALPSGPPMTKPGYILSPRGRALLDAVFPHLLRTGYPVFVAGHSASRRDEEGAAYVADPDNRSADLTWLLSFRRALAVYRRLAELGMPRERLGMAAYGSSRPRFSENSPEGRRKNRRVDLVLDGRDKEHLDRLETLREKDGIKREMYYRGFKFDLDVPGAAPGGAAVDSGAVRGDRQ
ncbi:MAG: OmpA family protein [Desulfovibrio sp.]|jgi:chemotaxis protein MotB|nr:OmpA family protein [Desulfovibrio sp.]